MTKTRVDDDVIRRLKAAKVQQDAGITLAEAKEILAMWGGGVKVGADVFFAAARVVAAFAGLEEEVVQPITVFPVAEEPERDSDHIYVPPVILFIIVVVIALTLIAFVLSQGK